MVRRGRGSILSVLVLCLIPSVLLGQEFSGSGPSASQPFTLPGGMIRVEMEHSGPGEFRARLLDREGTLVEELARTNGPFTGSRALQLQGGSGYLLDVAASGTWTVSFRTASAEEEVVLSPQEEEARTLGVAAGREPGTLGWFGAGLVAGAVSGPIGAVVVTRMAGRDSALPGTVDNPFAGNPSLDPHFQSGVRESLKLRRQRSALRGSLVGTVILGFVIIRYTDITRPGGGGVEPPPPLVDIMGGFYLPR